MAARLPRPFPLHLPFPLLVLFGSIVLFLASARLISAEGFERPSGGVLSYDALRQRYFRLRNTDLRIEQERDWRAVAEDLYQLSSAVPAHPEQVFALWNLSHLYERLYERFRREGDALKSIAPLNRMVREHPQHDLADDALFRAALLQERLFSDWEAARALHERMLTRFPRSEYVIRARHALRAGTAEVGTGARLSMEEADFNRTRPRVVVLDPGHGGEDLGARGQVGLYEKDVVLAIALEAERLLEARADIQVELTRRVDEFVPLAMRTQFANQWSADAFVSLHNNASEQRSLSGLQVFYLDAASDEAGRLLAERENSGSSAAAGQLDDIDLILGDLAQSAKQEPSIALAHILNERILASTKTVWPEVRASGVRPGPFYVLVGARMPCALVELFFIDHAGDGAQLARSRFREAIARGLVTGIKTYLDRLPDEHSH